ncbi:hypothetical protein BS78_06G007500 [Paspalum vaginatum]|uniref:Uncharacterized protein n=1 Tax=Paspalum vaginatum TaxID=158149 RepID=A0A9W7XBS3_9POAL|nr:hypothetical protein BS78_K223600 [Paspalum vaginatum]KAJ1269824.1 hypothetical protein BS78_06G007500 [Paspalum vaginatum]
MYNGSVAASARLVKSGLLYDEQCWQGKDDIRHAHTAWRARAAGVLLPCWWRSSSSRLCSAAGVGVAAAAAAAQRPPAAKKQGRRYMLMEVQPPGADKKKLRMAMREDGSVFAGYANGRQRWFATAGVESLLPFRSAGGNSKDRSRVNAAVGQGLGKLLALAMVLHHNRSTTYD